LKEEVQDIPHFVEFLKQENKVMLVLHKLLIEEIKNTGTTYNIFRNISFDPQGRIFRKDCLSIAVATGNFLTSHKRRYLRFIDD